MPRSVLALLAALVFVLGARAEPAKTQSLREFVLKNKTRHAVGLYIGNKKAGWMITELSLTTSNGQEVAVETNEMVLSLIVNGKKNEMSNKETVHYALEGDGPMIFARETKVEDGKETVYTASPTAKGLRIEVKGPDAAEPREVPMPKSNLAQARRMMQWLEGGPKANDTFEHWGTDWENANVDTKEVVTYIGKKEVVIGGLKTQLHHVSFNLKGAVMDGDILANGNPIRGRIANIELRAEAEETVKNLEKGGVDLVDASSIKIDKSLGHSPNVVALTLEVGGTAELKVPESHRQRLRVEDGKKLLELKADFRVERATPLSDEDRKKFTAATPTIQSDHARVKKLAAEILGKEKTDPLTKARKIKTWVHDHLDQRLDANSSTTLGVLERMAGDCTEHTLLFVSLARAAGVPARELTGVAHVAGSFGWHAWAEVHDGHQWVSVDPTWNELYVDATHIVFSHDSEDHSWLNVLGAVEFKAIKVEKKK